MLADDKYLDIKPASYELEERRAAVAQANGLGKGVRMEIGNTWTHYWATSSVPIGHIEIWMARTYSGMQEHAITLKSADEPFEAWNWKWPRQPDPEKAKVWEEALAAVQEQINKNVPITAETVLKVENPYA